MGVEMPLPNWAHDAFGDRAAPIRRGVAESLAAALGSAQNAQDASETKMLHPFGFTLMSRKFESLTETFKEMDDVQVIKPAGTSYELVIVSGNLLFPFKYAKDLSVNVMTARISDTRPSGLVQALFERFGPDPKIQQLPFPEGADGEDLAGTASYTRTLAQLPEETKLVLIAYACNAKGGLLNAWWGHAELWNNMGDLHWHNCDPVPLVKDLPPDGIRGLGDGPAAPPRAPRFDQGAMPSTSLTARPPLEQKNNDTFPPTSETAEAEPDANHESK